MAWHSTAPHRTAPHHRTCTSAPGGVCSSSPLRSGVVERLHTARSPEVDTTPSATPVTQLGRLGTPVALLHVPAMHGVGCEAPTLHSIA
jgi:hypothetical protein